MSEAILIQLLIIIIGFLTMLVIFFISSMIYPLDAWGLPACLLVFIGIIFLLVSAPSSTFELTIEDGYQNGGCEIFVKESEKAFKLNCGVIPENLSKGDKCILYNDDWFDREYDRMECHKRHSLLNGDKE